MVSRIGYNSFLMMKIFPEQSVEVVMNALIAKIAKCARFRSKMPQ